MRVLAIVRKPDERRIDAVGAGAGDEAEEECGGWIHVAGPVHLDIV